MLYSLNNTENYTIVTIHADKLNVNVSAELKSLFVLLNSKEVKNIIIDLSEVSYCDSSGLGALLMADRLCEESGGVMVLVNPKEFVQKLIAISQLTNVFKVQNSLPLAIDLVFEKNIIS